ncbi:MAG: hypothetical protein AMXMBFR58_30730 [Phycisphaerae bacterium]|nr:hypothetical protein [Phycisphaerales bacterium]
MNRTLRSILTASAVVLVCAFAIVPEALAQQNQSTPLQMPSPNKEENPKLLMQYFALIVIGAAAVGANLIPSKRGHQD